MQIIKENFPEEQGRVNPTVIQPGQSFLIGLGAKEGARVIGDAIGKLVIIEEDAERRNPP